MLVTLENGAATVIVSGFAGNPGKLEFDRPKTVYQAVMEAGGVSDYGSASNVHLTRIINGQQRTEIVNLRPTICPRRRRDLRRAQLVLTASAGALDC